MPYLKLSLLLITILAETIFSVQALAQFQASDISSVYEIPDTEAKEGDILIAGLMRASQPFDNRLFGVLQTQSLLVYRRIDSKGQPVVRNGNTKVNVTTLNGPISVGDYITSSVIPGKGQKANGGGYVIGIALTPFEEKDGQLIDYIDPGTNQTKQIASGQITVALKFEYAEISKSRSTAHILDSFNIALFSSIKDPDKFAQVFRYIAAGLAVVISFGLGFFTFSRSIPKGIEAIGRNPLAEKAILFSIILNIFFTVATTAVGIIAAAFILRL